MNRKQTHRCRNILPVHFCFPYVAAGLSSSPVLPGMVDLESEEDHERLLASLKGKPAFVLRASLYNDLGCLMAGQSNFRGAVRMISRAWQELETSSVDPSLSLAQASELSLTIMAQAGDAESARRLALSRDLLRRAKHPVFTTPLLSTITANLEAARIRLAAESGVKLYLDASDCFENNEFDSAVGLLSRAAEELDQNLGRTELRWPIAACQHDLGMCKLWSGNYDQDEAEAHVDEAHRIARSCEHPGRWFSMIEYAASPSP